MGEAAHKSKLEQYRKQDGACWLCSEPMDMFQPVHAWGSPSWEHVIPRLLGGSDRPENLVLTHMECNKARGDKFVFRISRPASPLEMVQMQSPKRAQDAFYYVWRRVQRAMKRYGQVQSLLSK
jgi:hypothetical protein